MDDPTFIMVCVSDYNMRDVSVSTSSPTSAAFLLEDASFFIESMGLALIEAVQVFVVVIVFK